MATMATMATIMATMAIVSKTRPHEVAGQPKGVSTSRYFYVHSHDQIFY